VRELAYRGKFGFPEAASAREQRRAQIEAAPRRVEEIDGREWVVVTLPAPEYRPPQEYNPPHGKADSSRPSFVPPGHITVASYVGH